MRKRIIIGLGLHAIIFIAGGLYILQIIEGATARLDNLIQLHQVEIMREHYLNQIRRVQADLTLRGTQHARQFDTVVSQIRNMQMFIDTCFGCHHAPPVLERIADLKRRTGFYQDHLSRVLTIRANEERLAKEQDAAFRLGEDLIDRVGEMIAIAGSRLETATQQTMMEIENTKYILYLLVGIGPLLSTWLGFVVISSLSSPGPGLVDATKKFEDGDLDYRVVGLKDEFGEVARSINEMAASLKKQMLEMQHTEQMVVLGELAAGLAHEIKNPLAGIKVAMHVLAEENYLSEEDRDVVRRVGQEVTRLESLMKHFLDFARPRKPQFDAIDVNALVNTTLAFYTTGKSRSANRASGIEIAKDLGSIPSTMADPMQLKQVILNLVINAVDAMPGGGTLSVKTSYDEGPGLITIEVADTGVGVDPKDADKIFQPFFTSKPKGTGLGLAICRQLIEQHEGSITLGRNADRGARFIVSLPLRPVDARGRA